VVKDVLVGEVWVASGQSNMAFALQGAVGAEEEIPKADFPEIRLFTVPKKIALSPQEDTRPTVAKPVSVRYAWGDSPPCNLFNKEGLPASPFRTDDWPGITEGK